MVRARFLLVVALSTGALACADGSEDSATGGSSGETQSSTGDVVVVSGSSSSAGSGGEQSGAETQSEPPLPRACPPPEGVSARPESVEDVVALLGALPLPTTLPCFLESLERPLEIFASTNDFSAQPADGPENPRLFVISGPLTMSLVPTGVGSELLELAVDIGGRESIKAEIEFPIEERLTPAAPYERIARVGGTACGVCHVGERLYDGIDFTEAYVSEALQSPEEHRLSLGFVQEHATLCDTENPDERCEMLISIFLHGEVVNTPLPAENRICRGP